MVERRHLVIGMASLPFAAFISGALAPAFSQTGATLDGDTLATADGDLIIHPVSHASLLLGWKDQVIYVDPVGGGAA